MTHVVTLPNATDSSHVSLMTLEFCLRVISPSLIMLLHSAVPAFSSCVRWDRSNRLCCRTWQQNLCTLSSAVDWTAATVSCSVSLVNCCTDCKWSRMSLLVLLPEPRGMSIWRQFCAVCTGYLVDIGSRSRYQSPCSSVSTVWRRCISHSTARWRHLMLVVVTCDLPTLASSSFHAWGQVTVTVVFVFMDRSCGILCYTTCGQLTYLWPHSEIDWKHSCLTLTRSSTFAALVNLGYTSNIIKIKGLYPIQGQGHGAFELPTVADSCTVSGLSPPPLPRGPQNWWLTLTVWDLGYSLSQPYFEFPSRKGITRVQTSRNVDISRHANGHISVVRDATVRCLGTLVVLHIACMFMWPWPDPRSRSWSRSQGFWTSDS